jgi:hypothetical protein
MAIWWAHWFSVTWTRECQQASATRPGSSRRRCQSSVGQRLSPGGWREVLNQFKSDHVSQMEKWVNRYMVLLLDFDEESGRLEEAKSFIPENLHERVLILGVWSEPKRIKVDLGRSYEEIGRDLAKECRQGRDAIWAHRLLRTQC